MPVTTRQFIAALIEPEFVRGSRRNHALTVMEQLLLTLRFLATLAFFRLIGDSVGISECQVSHTVEKVCTALTRLPKRYIRFPVGPDAARIKADFYRIAGMNNDNLKNTL